MANQFLTLSLFTFVVTSSCPVPSHSSLSVMAVDQMTRVWLAESFHPHLLLDGDSSCSQDRSETCKGLLRLTDRCNTVLFCLSNYNKVREVVRLLGFFIPNVDSVPSLTYNLIFWIFPVLIFYVLLSC